MDHCKNLALRRLRRSREPPTFTPLQEPEAQAVTIAYTDSWRAPFSVPGAVVKSGEMYVLGVSAVIPGGWGSDPLSGRGYDSATFRDLQSGKDVTIYRFIATVTTAGSASLKSK